MSAKSGDPATSESTASHVTLTHALSSNAQRGPAATAPVWRGVEIPTTTTDGYSVEMLLQQLAVSGHRSIDALLHVQLAPLLHPNTCIYSLHNVYYAQAIVDNCKYFTNGKIRIFLNFLTTYLMEIKVGQTNEYISLSKGKFRIIRLFLKPNPTILLV